MKESNLSETQLAYLAGLMDGEGFLGCQKEILVKGRTPRFRLEVSFSMTTREPLDTIASWLGLNVKGYPRPDERRSPVFRLHIKKSVSVPLLKLCIPFLILKKRQAEIMIEIENVRSLNSPNRHHFGSNKMSQMPPDAIKEMDILYDELKSLKSSKKPGSKGKKSQ